MAPEIATRYADNEGTNLAYRVMGGGERDLLLYPGALFLPMECVDDEPHYARFRERLASYCRVIQFDARGDRALGPDAAIRSANHRAVGERRHRRARHRRV